MKKQISILLLILATRLFSYAQVWTDVTSFFITNPNYQNGSTSGWAYYYNRPTMIDGVASFSTNNYAYLYQSISALPAGDYRLSYNAFYRNGTVSNDYTLFSNGRHPKVAYVEVYTQHGTFNSDPVPSLASGGVPEPIGGVASKLANGNFVPANNVAAKAWFEAGYYRDTMEFSMKDEESMYISMEKLEATNGGWLCFGNWKLERKGELRKMTSLTLDVDEFSMVPEQTIYLYHSYMPSDVTVRKVVWTSSNPDVAAVDEYGNVVALKKGTAVIKVQSVDGSNLSASCKITVRDADIATSDNIIINEVMVANNGTIISGSFNYCPWIELYNPTNDIINVSRLFISDDPENLTKSKLNCENHILGAKGYLVVDFGYYDAIFSPNQIPFKLDVDGGAIYISNGKDILASVEYPAAKSRLSYARVIDGKDDWAWSVSPTYGYGNANSSYAFEQLPAPVIEENGGFHTGDIKVHIDIPEGTVIRYTLNGAVPTPYYGEILEESTLTIPANKSTVIRARAFKEGYLPSDVTTRSFLAKDRKYVFPVISIAADMYDLNGSEYGIFVGSGWGYGRPGNGQSYSCNWNADWDRPVNFEYITADGEYALNQEVEISSCGGWSRAYSPHSFKLKASKYFAGLNSMDYQFFDDKPFQKHKVLQIRNGGNDTQCRIKDAAIQNIIRTSGLNVNTQAWQPVHVFFNGEYYDVLNMREPNNKHYAYSNYGYDTDEVDQFEMSPDSGYVQKEGTDEKFLEWYDLSADAENADTYGKICELVDIDEFINYMAVELYLGNKDWPQNNVKGFRSREDGKFHFVIFDLDLTGDLSSSPFTTFASKKNYTFDTLYGDYRTPWKTGDHVKAEIKLVTIFLNMLNNDSFRRQFIDSYCVIAGSVFNPNRVKTIVNEMVSYMNSGMAINGGSSTSSGNTVISALSSTKQSELLKYLKNYEPMGLKSTANITANIDTDLPESEIFINNVKIPTGSLSGTLYGPITIRTAAPAGYKFLGWSKLKMSEIFDTNLEVQVTGTIARYYAHWAKMTDEEMIAAGVNPSPVVINEVSASNSVYVNDYYKKSDWIELYNTTDQDVNIAGLQLTDKIDNPSLSVIPADDPSLNTIIPAHGYKVIWCDKKENISDAIHANFKLDADEGTIMISMPGADSDTFAYSDTLSYTAHEGTQSHGRYPDGGLSGYLMQKATPGKSNIIYSDLIPFALDNYLATDIEQVRMAESAGITIAYVGDGIVNVKSEDADLRSLTIYSASGSVCKQIALSGSFATVSLSDLPHGMYIVRVKNAAGREALLKIGQ